MAAISKRVLTRFSLFNKKEGERPRDSICMVHVQLIGGSSRATNTAFEIGSQEPVEQVLSRFPAH
jgi:hypothetical protein